MGGRPTSTPAPFNEMVADAGRWGTRSKAGGSLRPKLHLRRVLESCSVSIAQCPLHSEGLLKCCIAATATKVGICPTGALGEFLSSPPIITKRGRGGVRWTRRCRVRMRSQGDVKLVSDQAKARETSGIAADGGVVWSWHPLLVSGRAEVTRPNRVQMNLPIRADSSEIPWLADPSRNGAPSGTRSRTFMS
jgi:hypothetical protein